MTRISRKGFSLKKKNDLGVRLCLHVALFLGGCLFSLPFLWLITTSFKEDDEIFSDPPRWLPRLPTYSLSSPFVDPQGTYPFMPARDQPVLRTRWNQVTFSVEEGIWKALSMHLQSDSWISHKPTLPMTVQTRLRDPLIAAAWSRIALGMPDEVQKGDPQQVSDWVIRRIGMDETEGAWRDVVRVFCLGKVSLMDRNEAELDGILRLEDWDVKDPLIQDSEWVTLEGEDGLALSYDLSHGKGFKVIRKCFVEAGASQVGRIDLSYHSDKSWHRLECRVSTADGVWISERKLPLGENTWQEWTYQFERPRERDSLVIPLILSQEKSDVKDPRWLEIEMTILRSSRPHTIFMKFCRNYREALRYVPFWTYAKNSLFLVLMNVIGQLFACSLVGYAFARLSWYGRDTLFMILLSTMMIPAEVTMIPYFVVIRELHWYNTLKVLWVPAFFGTPFFIFLLRQFYKTIPNDLEDAAKIDGCGLGGIYWRIMLPLIKPALATIAIFQFMGTWNDFMRPLIFINSEALTPLPLGLYVFRTEYAAEYGMMMAASGLMTVPVIATFFLAQRYFIQGVTLTGIKG